jgi:hypothetical protein
MAIEAEALRAQPSASELANRVCHEEQLMIWAGEITGSLSAGGYLREDFSYEDILDAGAMVANCIRSIVESAFGHPELKTALIHRSALAEDTARAAEGWELIEGAPHNELILIGRYSDGKWDAQTFVIEDANWREAFDWIDDEPTHWMRLPAPPALPLDKEAADANR